MAHHSDERLWLEQRAALRNAISEFRNLFGDANEIDPRFVRMVEQSARLHGLKFETEPGGGEPRDAAGAGRQWPHRRVLHLGQDPADDDGDGPACCRLSSASAFALVGFAGISLWQLRRAARELAASEDLAQRAADADKLTGLPNHAKTLELLDLYLAERAGNEVTTFALIELDGMEDVTAHLGVLGSDELIVAVADRLRERLAGAARCAGVSAATNSR